MKQRAPRKARNMAAKAMRECKLFAPKTIAPKKGKGTVYSRKGRDAKGPPGLYSFYDRVIRTITRGMKWNIRSMLFLPRIMVATAIRTS